MSRQRFFPEAEFIRLPQPPAAPLSARGFAFCPAVVLPGLTVEQWLMQQWVYQQALAEAQAVVRPSVLERNLVAGAN